MVPYEIIVIIMQQLLPPHLLMHMLWIEGLHMDMVVEGELSVVEVLQVTESEVAEAEVAKMIEVLHLEANQIALTEDKG